MFLCGGRGPPGAQRRRCLPALLQVLDRLPGPAGADAFKHLQDAHPAQIVLRILEDAQKGEQVLHVGRFKETQSAPFDKRHVAPAQLHFQRVGIMAGAEEHGLSRQGDPFLTMLQQAIHEVIALLDLAGAGNQQRLLAAGALGPEVLRKTPAGLCHDRVRGFQDRRHTPIVLIERDGGRPRKLLGKAQDVLDSRAAKGIDRLRVIAHDHDGAIRRIAVCVRIAGLSHEAPGFFQDGGLNGVCVLIFIDEDVLKAPGKSAANSRLGECLLPVEEQVVVIKQLTLAFAFHIFLEDALDLRTMVVAPWEAFGEDLFERLTRVHAARIDGQQRAFLGEARC